MDQGYRLFSGGSLRLENVDVDVDKDVGSPSDFIKRLTLLLRKERVAESEYGGSKFQSIY